MTYLPHAVIGLILLVGLISSFAIVQQGHVAVTQIFGKFKRVMLPGLNFKTPFIEFVVKRISTQNQTSELKFQAITKDQANVHFSAMLMYSVLNSESETVKLATYKFINQEAFQTALSRIIESSVRSLVAGKKQADVLGLRQEIVIHVKENVDNALEAWGYHLIDLQINDITFDKDVMDSMARVVAAINNKNAAENEGEALKITTKKEAEAYADSSTIRAKGLSDARKMLNTSMKNMDPSVMTMLNLDKYCDTLKEVAQNGTGKIIFMDTGGDSFKNLVGNLYALNNPDDKKPQKPKDQSSSEKKKPEQKKEE